MQLMTRDCMTTEIETLLSNTEHSWELCSGVLDVARLRVTVQCGPIGWSGL